MSMWHGDRKRETAHIAHNIAETCQKYFQSFIAIEILSQSFCQKLQNISLQHYNFNILKYFCKQINIWFFLKYCRQLCVWQNVPILHFSRIFLNIKSEDDTFFFKIIFLTFSLTSKNVTYFCIPIIDEFERFLRQIIEKCLWVILKQIESKRMT